MNRPIAPGTPFGDGPRRRAAELPVSLVELAVAAALRRNPPCTPWWRRYVRSWQRFESSTVDPVDDVVLYGLTKVWNEDDVIYATVRNLLLEGVDEVLVIDDDSDDDTAAEAEAAGATVLHQPSDGVFLERRRTEHLLEVIEQRTAAVGGEVWWIVVDADEFPRGPAGGTIRDLVRRLPADVDTVGSRVLEHYPSRNSAPAPRFHPLDQLPMAHWHEHPACPAGHWKHQLLRVRRPAELRFMPGRHTIAAPPERKPVVESAESLLMHHFPLRGLERTDHKLRASVTATGRYTRSRDSFLIGRVERRRRMLRLAYQERYDEVPNLFPGRPKVGVSPCDWRELVPSSERNPRHRQGVTL